MWASHHVEAMNLDVGTRFTNFSAYEMGKQFRARLSEAGMERASRTSFKAFRAGSASAMAAAGESLAAILQAGEWRSAALLR